MPHVTAPQQRSRKKTPRAPNKKTPRAPSKKTLQAPSDKTPHVPSIKTPHTPIDDYSPFNNLPTEVCVNLIKKLPFADAVCFALTCKVHFQLHKEFNKRQSSYPELKETFLRLQTGWVPKDLKWCHNCGEFKTQDEAYWRAMIVEKSKGFGMAAQTWACWTEPMMCGDQGVGHVITDWCNTRARMVNSNVKQCPQCCVTMLAGRRVRDDKWDVTTHTFFRWGF